MKCERLGYFRVGRNIVSHQIFKGIELKPAAAEPVKVSTWHWLPPAPNRFLLFSPQAHRSHNGAERGYADTCSHHHTCV